MLRYTEIWSSQFEQAAFFSGFEPVTSGDFDKDGLVEILLGNQSNISAPYSLRDNLPIYIERHLDQTFYIDTIWTAGVTPLGWANDIVVGDFNEDGVDDFFIIDHGREDKPYELRDFAMNALYLSTESKTWEDRTEQVQQSRSFWHGAWNTRDFNGDGHLDLIATALAAEKIDLWLGDGRGNFSQAQTNELPDFLSDRNSYEFEGQWTSFGVTAFIDAGGDGKEDIVAMPYGMGTEFANKSIIAINKRSDINESFINLGRSDLVDNISLGRNRGYSAILVEDFDGNGLEDFIGLAEASNGQNEGEMFYRAYYQTAPYIFEDKTLFVFGSYSSYSTTEIKFEHEGISYYQNGPSTEFYIGDFNRDGHADIFHGFPFLGNSNALYTNIWLNDGLGKLHRLREGELLIDPTLTGIRSDLILDINGDEISDILVIDTDYDSGRISPSNRYGEYYNIKIFSSSPQEISTEIPPGFNENFYTNYYPDVSLAIGEGRFNSPLEHYLTIGKTEGRYSFAPNTKIWGSNAADHIFLREGDEIAKAGQGNDFIFGAQGSDQIDGGEGNDTSSYTGASYGYSTVYTSSSFIIGGRRSISGTDALTSIEYIQFTDATIETAWFSKTDALTNSQSDSLVELYIASFNRAPDAIGLNYWGGRLYDGMALSQIAKSFFVQPETVAAYPASMATRTFVTTVYNNVLSRAPDTEGLNYWAREIDTGSVTKDVFLLAIINGAKASSGSAVDRQTLANKVSVGNYFAFDKGINNTTWGIDVMDSVTSATSTVTAANALTDTYSAAIATGTSSSSAMLLGVPDNSVNLELV